MQTLKYFHIGIEANYCGADCDLYVSHTENIKKDTILLNVLEEVLNNISLESFGCCNYDHMCDYDEESEDYEEEVIIKAVINEISKEEIEEENIITYDDFIKENFVY